MHYEHLIVPLGTFSYLALQALRSTSREQWIAIVWKLSDEYKVLNQSHQPTNLYQSNGIFCIGTFSFLP